MYHEDRSNSTISRNQVTSELTRGSADSYSESLLFVAGEQYYVHVSNLSWGPVFALVWATKVGESKGKLLLQECISSNETVNLSGAVDADANLILNLGCGWGQHPCHARGTLSKVRLYIPPHLRRR